MGSVHLGVLSIASKTRFDLSDIGLLDASDERDFGIVLSNARDLTGARNAFFLVSDPDAIDFFVRATSGPEGPLKPGGRAVPNGSVSASVLSSGATLSISELRGNDKYNQGLEAKTLKAKNYVAAPVHGPIGDVIGVLGVADVPRDRFSDLAEKILADQAFLLSRIILLKASLLTLKLMSREKSETASSDYAVN